MRKSFIFVILSMLLLAWITLNNLVDDWGRLEGGWENLTTFVTESMWPPNWSVLEAQSYPVCEKDIEFFCSVGYLGMVETIKIAFVSTILGFIGALCLSSFAARNLMPMYIAYRSDSSLQQPEVFHRLFGQFYLSSSSVLDHSPVSLQ